MIVAVGVERAREAGSCGCRCTSHCALIVHRPCVPLLGYHTQTETHGDTAHTHTFYHTTQTDRGRRAHFCLLRSHLTDGHYRAVGPRGSRAFNDPRSSSRDNRHRHRRTTSRPDSTILRIAIEHLVVDINTVFNYSPQRRCVRTAESRSRARLRSLHAG